MNFLQYKLDDRADLLFPNIHEGYDNQKASISRIKRYLKKEDQEWAKRFTSSIMRYEDYTDIKKELHATQIEDLSYHYETLQDIIEKTDKETFLEVLKNFNQIIKNTKKVISELLALNFNHSIIIESQTDIEYILNLFGYYLFQEDSPILSELEVRYKNINKQFEDNAYLKIIIEKEMERLPKYVYTLYKDYIRKYYSIVGKRSNVEYYTYASDQYAHHQRELRHNHGGRK